MGATITMVQPLLGCGVGYVFALAVVRLAAHTARDSEQKTIQTDGLY